VFSSENEYITYFDDVAGLQNSNPVTLNGVNVGRVMAVEIDENPEKVKVVLAINKKVNVTDQSYITLADDGLLGGKLIRLTTKKGITLEDGQEITSAVEKGLMASAADQISPTLGKVDSLLATLQTTVASFSQTSEFLNYTLVSAGKTTDGVNALLANNAKNLAQTTKNTADLTANLKSLSLSLDQQLKPLLAKTNTIADSVAALQLGQTVLKLNATMQQLSLLVGDIEKGKGSVGKLMKDESMYIHLDKTAANLQALFADMKENPKRYVHFSLFGKKQVPASEADTSKN
jgi:phospholipid/cholesterol/gamma-HCH transport system substrate-binding protein